jgi:glycosyltransferase involved in cell wall biosynthesis
MENPDLTRLPPAPPGIINWLSTNTIPRRDETLCEGLLWPRISVVTPSLNQGQFLEEAIRSVLLQGYPNLEYIIIDGGSTDYSVEIIKKYEPWLDYWISEPDRGQAHAINKGFHRATGDLLGWINSDDLLLPGALFSLSLAFRNNPEAILIGDVINFHENSKKTKTIIAHDVNFEGMVLPAVSGLSWHQPGIYVPASLVRKGIILDESLRYLFDQDWMCRLLQHVSVSYLHRPIAKFRIHSNSKTVGENFFWLSEMEIVAKRYWVNLSAHKKRRIEAHLEMVRGATFLGNTRWNRQMGWRLLFKSFQIFPPISFSWSFLGLVLRSIFPFRFLSWVKIWVDKWM